MSMLPVNAMKMLGRMILFSALLFLVGTIFDAIATFAWAYSDSLRHQLTLRQSLDRSLAASIIFGFPAMVAACFVIAKLDQMYERRMSTSVFR